MRITQSTIKRAQLIVIVYFAEIIYTNRKDELCQDKTRGGMIASLTR